MGCVRDPGSEEELATVGKLLGEVDRCREPSETLCHHSPLVNFSLSRPPDCIRAQTLISPTCYLLRRNTSVTGYG